MTLSTMSKNVKSVPGDPNWPLGKFIKKSNNEDDNCIFEKYNSV